MIDQGWLARTRAAGPCTYCREARMQLTGEIRRLSATGAVKILSRAAVFAIAKARTEAEAINAKSHA